MGMGVVSGPKLDGSRTFDNDELMGITVCGTDEDVTVGSVVVVLHS